MLASRYLGQTGRVGMVAYLIDCYERVMYEDRYIKVQSYTHDPIVVYWDNNCIESTIYCIHVAIYMCNTVIYSVQYMYMCNGHV